MMIFFNDIMSPLIKPYDRLGHIVVFLCCISFKLSAASYERLSGEGDDSSSVDTIIIHEEGEPNTKVEGLTRFFDHELKRLEVRCLDSQLEMVSAIILFDEHESVFLVQSVLRQYAMFLKRRQTYIYYRFFVKESFDIKEGYRLARLEWKKRERLLKERAELRFYGRRVHRPLQVEEAERDKHPFMQKMKSILKWCGCET